MVFVSFRAGLYQGIVKIEGMTLSNFACRIDYLLKRRAQGCTAGALQTGKSLKASAHLQGIEPRLSNGQGLAATSVETNAQGYPFSDSVLKMPISTEKSPFHDVKIRAMMTAVWCSMDLDTYTD